MIKNELEFGLDKYDTYKNFGQEIYAFKDKIVRFMTQIKNEKKRIVGYGAPAKATTALNFYGINNKYIDYIVKDNKLKHNLTVPGVRIPIVSKEKLDNDVVDYAVILAWNFAEEILRKNEKYRARGMKFIIPTAKLEVV